ncbi:MAG: hypothetical protein CMJ58_14225 [Planctomycetaceae bacterium]|nr:hypothetical protein [Planctomycetaceae bacterium]
MAELWGVSPDTVLKWILSGELQAFNVAKPGAKRPRYRVTLTAAENFQAGRAAVKRRKTPRRRCKPPNTDEIDFYPD